MIALHRVPRIGTRGVALASAVGAVMLAGCVAGGVPARSHEQASQIVLGSDGHGVSVDHRIGVTFIFDRSAAGRYKQIAGRKVLAACDQITRSPGSQLLLDSSSAVSELRAPNHRAAIYTGYGGRSDFCRLGLPLRNNKERVVATVPLSRLGYYYVDQQHVAQDILTLAFWPSGLLRKYEQRLLRSLDGVTLPSEGATPPAGKLGLYSSGTHRYVAKRDRAGYLLFFQQDGPVSRTDMLGLLTDPPSLGPNAQGIEQRQS